jgi:Family of unknown function (DUF6498)
MLLAAPENSFGWAAKLFMIPFFCVHYGMFTLIHGFFVIALFGHGTKIHLDIDHPHFHIIGHLAQELWCITQANGLGLAILSLVVSRGISFYSNYLRNGEYQRASLNQLMGQPYSRIMVLHLAILVGGVLMLGLDSPTAGLLALVALKTLLDLRGHLKERAKFAEPPTTV